MVASLLLGLLGAVGLSGLGLGLASATVAPEPVVPDLVGRELGEARAVLAERGLSAVVNGDPEGVEPDPRSVVVEQDPVAGAPADPGMDVLLFVEAVVEVPDLRGLTEDDARRLAQSRGLNLFVTVRGEAEFVTDQEVKPGSLVPVGTGLRVFLEGGPEPRNVIPLLVGGGLLLVTAGGLAGRAARRSRQRRWVRENVQVRVVPFPPTAHVEAAQSTAPSVKILVRQRTGHSEVHIRTEDDPEA